jgi:proline dehydrogenase
MMRSMLLRASESRWLAERASRYGFVRRAVSRFMPGERLEDALSAAAKLSSRGIATVLTQLGENVTNEEDAEAVADHYVEQVDSISVRNLDAETSVKVTQLGLDLGRELCERNLHRVLARAAAAGRRVWIDMEGSAYTDRTLDLFRAARQQYPLTGLCLQAYLHRTERDLDKLLLEGAAVRLVKGAYNEPPERAYPHKADVDRNFLALAGRFLEPAARQAGARLSVATHDTKLIGEVTERMAAAGLPKDSIELQFLYGIRSELQQSLASSGRPVRVLISYGTSWFPWYVRRLAERPANLTFVLRSLVGG